MLKLICSYMSVICLPSSAFNPIQVGKWPAELPAAKRLACVAPMYVAFASAKKNKYGKTHSGFKTQRRRHQKSKTGIPVAQENDICPPRSCSKLPYVIFPKLWYCSQCFFPVVPLTSRQQDSTRNSVKLTQHCCLATLRYLCCHFTWHTLFVLVGMYVKICINW